MGETWEFFLYLRWISRVQNLFVQNLGFTVEDENKMPQGKRIYLYCTTKFTTERFKANQMRNLTLKDIILLSASHFFETKNMTKWGTLRNLVNGETRCNDSGFVV